MEGEQPYLGDWLTMVINHLLAGMIIPVPSRERTHIPPGEVGKIIDSKMLAGDGDILIVPSKIPWLLVQTHSHHGLPHMVFLHLSQTDLHLHVQISTTTLKPRMFLAFQDVYSDQLDVGEARLLTYDCISKFGFKKLHCSSSTHRIKIFFNPKKNATKNKAPPAASAKKKIHLLFTKNQKRFPSFQWSCRKFVLASSWSTTNKFPVSQPGSSSASLFFQGTKDTPKVREVVHGIISSKRTPNKNQGKLQPRKV